MGSVRCLLVGPVSCLTLMVWVATPASPAGEGDQGARETGPAASSGSEIPIDLLRKKVELFKASVKLAAKRSDREAAIGQYLSIIDQAVVDLGPKEAASMTSLVEAVAKDLKSPWVASHLAPYRDLLKKKKEVEEAVQAADALRRDPEDQLSLSRLGRFQCFVLGKWPEGLAKLSRGSDPKIAEIARKDLSNPGEGKDAIALGDSWTGAAAFEKGEARAALLARGCHWYQKALASAGGAEKLRLEQFLLDAPWRYLADMEEFDVQVGWNKFCKDGTASGKPLVVNSIQARKGLFLHPPANGSSRVRYLLRKRYRTLECQTALVDGTENFKSELVFQVLGDGRVLWQSDPVTACGTSRPCKVGVAGVEVLELQIQCKGRNQSAGACWLDPKVIR